MYHEVRIKAKGDLTDSFEAKIMEKMNGIYDPRERMKLNHRLSGEALAEIENKAAFVDALGYALRNYTRLGIGAVVYNKTPDDRELVEILFLNGGILRVEVTADSCLARMKDICKALS